MALARRTEASGSGWVKPDRRCIARKRGIDCVENAVKGACVFSRDSRGLIRGKVAVVTEEEDRRLSASSVIFENDRHSSRGAHNYANL